MYIHNHVYILFAKDLNLDTDYEKTVDNLHSR